MALAAMILPICHHLIDIGGCLRAKTASGRLHGAVHLVAVQWLLKARQANPALPMSHLCLSAAYLGIGEGSMTIKPVSDSMIVILESSRPRNR